MANMNRLPEAFKRRRPSERVVRRLLYVARAVQLPSHCIGHRLRPHFCRTR
jgi:hypothetical protein